MAPQPQKSKWVARSPPGPPPLCTTTEIAAASVQPRVEACMPIIRPEPLIVTSRIRAPPVPGRRIRPAARRARRGPAAGRGPSTLRRAGSASQDRRLAVKPPTSGPMTFKHGRGQVVGRQRAGGRKPKLRLRRLPGQQEVSDQQQHDTTIARRSVDPAPCGRRVAGRHRAHSVAPPADWRGGDCAVLPGAVVAPSRRSGPSDAPAPTAVPAARWRRFCTGTSGRRTIRTRRVFCSASALAKAAPAVQARNAGPRATDAIAVQRPDAGGAGLRSLCRGCRGAGGSWALSPSRAPLRGSRQRIGGKFAIQKISTKWHHQRRHGKRRAAAAGRAGPSPAGGSDTGAWHGLCLQPKTVNRIAAETASSIPLAFIRCGRPARPR